MKWAAFHAPLALFGCIGCAGPLDQGPCKHSYPDCCVSLSNETGIRVIAVTVKTGHGDSVGFGHVSPAARAYFLLPSQRGECEYRIEAMTEDGRTRSGECGYYEGGYWLHNRILPDTIITDVP
ncbi:MAG: hypothetical protein KA791_03680 [Flavobacteriales bacterium]|jgi:hypothetical protein|nr:hypothetical protein [Flavobacteriales bacterium]